jgi:hypothetical protein
LWPAIIQKAWAKVLGNFGNLDLYFANRWAMSGILGVPTFDFWVYEMNQTSPWDFLNNAYQNNFVSIATNWKTYNECGLNDMQTVSVLATFNINLRNGSVIKATLFKNA